MKKYIIIGVLCAAILLTAYIPFTYLEPNYHIQKNPTGYNLSKGFMGLKVYKVMRRLNISDTYIRYDEEVEEAVKTFQRENNIEETGIVDLNTWIALGFTNEQWYDLECYISECKIDENSSYEERIQVMIDTAISYLGTEFVDGASGRAGSGIDCSGLIMQIMYSVGLDPEPISPLRHSQPEYEYESYSLWLHDNIKHYPYFSRKPGDLVFYHDSKGKVNHVGLYIGNDEMIEATREEGVKLTKITSTKNIKCVGRMIKAEQ